ncbi:MAG: ferritin-like fold-containing protein [Nitriliruptorales bacterium]|nr:ferritin-like fold-containing protein [Nitriliruptorales bacterium]
MSEERALATVELLGALAYGQLRAFETTVRAVTCAPDARRMDRVAEFSIHEHASYRVLRDHLVSLTDLGGAVMDRQKPLFDAFFDHAPIDDWVGACTFFAVGLPMAADFARELAPALEPETAMIVVGALADRGPFEEFAREELREHLAAEDEREQIKHAVGELLGRALTGFQAGIGDTDALGVLLQEAEDAPDTSGDELVKRMAMKVLENHRRRMHELGLEDLVE